MTNTEPSITFITGNQNKADYLAKYLGHPIAHRRVDLDEIQSLDLKEIVRHKAQQAYAVVQSPVLVEDVSLTFHALGRLPGPFIKHFIGELSPEEICRLLDGKDRAATAACVYGYYDGERLELFEGSVAGRVPEHPAGDGGFGFDTFFVPEGYAVTRAQMDESDYRTVYLKIKPIAQVARFLDTLQGATQ